MKYLVLAVVVLVAIWWLRGKVQRLNREEDSSGESQPDQRTTRKSLKAEAMLPCAHCGLHVAASDVVKGRLGVYCSDAHRQAAEAA